MITDMFATMVVSFIFILFIYTLVDNQNRVYGNIIAAGLNTLLSFAAALWFLQGNIVVDGTAYLDAGAGWFMITIGAVQGLIFLIYLMAELSEIKKGGGIIE